MGLSCSSTRFHVDPRLLYVEQCSYSSLLNVKQTFLRSSVKVIHAWLVFVATLCRSINVRFGAVDLYLGPAYITIFGNIHAHAQATGSTTTRSGSNIERS